MDEDPTQPVTQRTVTLQIRGRDVRAVLLTPARPGTALVVVHGSGPGDVADATSRARALAARGVAVLVPDKVLDGYSVLHRDYGRLGDDAVDAVRWLGADLGLDAGRVGLLGLSEGGWVSLVAAARQGLTGPVVLDSAPVVTPLEQAAYLVAGAGDLPPVRRVLTGLLATGRPLVDYLDADVRPALPHVTGPVVAVFGADDRTVPVAQAVARLRAGLPAEPRIVLTPGGHLPPAERWAPVVARALQTHHDGVGTWRVEGAQASESAPGAPTPPTASPTLDPRWHAVVAALLVLGARLLRTPHPRPQETTT